MKCYKILLLGSGGREHALAWKLAQSSRCQSLHCAPGNPGIAELAMCHAIDITSPEQVLGLAKKLSVDLVVIGPEAPLAAGVVDVLQEANVMVFGPSKAAAQLESSKAFTKTLCHEAAIPTAAFSSHDNLSDVISALETFDFPMVIKADGLAAGKGVVIVENKVEAIAALQDIFSGCFGSAGSSVVLEAFLEGEEASLFVLCDGAQAYVIGTAQDHKRLGDGDTGPNTGGMGAYSPAPLMTQARIDEVMARIINPTLETMKARGTPFVGFLYAGLMVTASGAQLIEYNVRFGDPECQVVMPRLKSDLVELLVSACEGRLETGMIALDPCYALTVVVAAEGYPQSPKKGGNIQLPQFNEADGEMVFHAGTHLDDSGDLRAHGGRVLSVTAWSDDIKSAAAKAYHLVDGTDYADAIYRKDIGYRAM